MALNLQFAPEDEAFREEVRDFLERHLDDDLREAARRQTTVFADKDVRIGKITCLFPTCLKHAQRFSNGQRRALPIHSDRHGENLTHHRVGFLQAREPNRKVCIH